MATGSYWQLYNVQLYTENTVFNHSSTRYYLKATNIPISAIYRQCINNWLRPSDAIWRHRSGSTQAQVMACCLTAPSHYLNQCWLTSVRSNGIHLRAISYEIPQSPFTKIILTITYLKLNWNIPGANEVPIILIWLYSPAQRSWWGVYWFHSVRPSVHPSVHLFFRPSRIMCPLCSAYSSGWIHLIFIHLIKQLQKVCHVFEFLAFF